MSDDDDHDDDDDDGDDDDNDGDDDGSETFESEDRRIRGSETSGPNNSAIATQEMHKHSRAHAQRAANN